MHFKKKKESLINCMTVDFISKHCLEFVFKMFTKSPLSFRRKRERQREPTLYLTPYIKSIWQLI